MVNRNLKTGLLIATFLLSSGIMGFAQQKYSGVFAPTENWVKPSEQPYRESICINGSWQFQPVALPAGFKEGVDKMPSLSRPSDAWAQVPVKVPSPWNINSFANKDNLGGDFRTYPSYPKEWENIKMGWLRKKVMVPANWKGKKVSLHFEAVAGDAEIIVNGKNVGSHFGIFLPFDVNITEAVQLGKENEILIGIRKASLSDQRSDYGRRTYQAGSFWGQHIVGIWQDVFIVATPKVSVTDVYVQSKLDSGKLRATITLRNDGETNADISVSGNIQPWKASNIVTIIKPLKINVPAGTTKTITLDQPINRELKEWSPSSPNLYGLNIQLSNGTTIIDNKYTRFGWRQVSLNSNQFLLNGKPLVLNGDSWHFMGIPQMTRRYAEAWYKALHDANLNAVRLHAQPYPSFYLDVADETGILVLDESAMWASDGGPKLGESAYWRDSERHMEALVKRDRNHPSVFGWSISNEIKPIIQNVMRNPPGMYDTLVEHYAKWAEICKRNDPSRPWISADGEDDGEGRLPIYMIHYGGVDAMKRAAQSGKPWGVGEAGNAYYGTPEQVSETNGDEAYTSFYGRMLGVAASSYQSLANQKQYNAIYRSVFNLAWYGLKPLALGMKDTTRAPQPTDGIFFTSYKEGVPGVQPERLGPYTTTLNPGYDPSLPLYQTWPLFDAIKDAASGKQIPTDKWKNRPTQTIVVETIKPVSIVGIASKNEQLFSQRLQAIGVKINAAQDVPDVLFLDVQEPSKDAAERMQKVYQKGGTVIAWGINDNAAPALKKLLPETFNVTSRTATSLLIGQKDAITNGVSLADLYFSELKPAEIVTNGLDGALVKKGKVLLQDCNTEWTLWNKQPEYAKTAMVLRSEREAKPSGVVLLSNKVGNGRLVLSTLPFSPRQRKGEHLVRRLMENMGVPLGSGSDTIKAMDKNGTITNALVLGSFDATDLKQAADGNWVNPASPNGVKLYSKSQDKQWQVAKSENGVFDIAKSPITGSSKHAVAYLSLWVFSPRPLDDLLIEPNMPSVNLEVAADDAAQAWLNGKQIINYIRQGSLAGGAKADALKLHQGWNHLLIKAINVEGAWKLTAKLTSSQPAFLNELQSALEKP